MIDLGKGVSVDSRENPYVFGIEGWDPIRIQKGKGRTTGVSLEQLEIIIKTIKKVKDGSKHNTTDAKSASAGKARSASGRSNKASAGSRPITK